MKKLVLFIAFVLSIFNFTVYSQVAMGNWRTHFAYNSVSQIAQSDNKVYAVSEGALYSVDKYDGGLEFYSKLSGLNGVNISKIEFDELTQQLLIIYTNGNIDVMGNGGVVNIPDLYNKQMSANKNVNSIHFDGSNAYLSCDFGIIVLNLERKEVADTYYIGANASDVKVLGTTVNKDSIYAVSASSIYKASKNELFLVNYELWSTLSQLPGSGDFQMIGSFNGDLILQRGGKLYRNSNHAWISLLPQEIVTYFNVSGTSLNVFTASSGFLIDTNYAIKQIQLNAAITDAKYDDANNTYWLAGADLGVVSYKQIDDETPEISYFKPVGPAVNIPWDMTFSGKKLFVVPGGRSSVQYFTAGVVMMYENGLWTNIGTKSISDSTKHDVLDFLNVAIDPTDNTHFFVTSYGTGLYEFKDNSFFKWYNHLNSNIVSVIPSNPYYYMRIDGAVYDKSGNLFITNSEVGSGIKILMKNGEWKELSHSEISGKPTLGKILISNQNENQKWVISFRSPPGIFIYDDNGTPDYQDDDSNTKFISTFNYPETDSNNQIVINSVTPSNVYALAQDKDGVIWVGTDQGPFLFSNLSSVFNTDYTCSRIKIPRNDSTNLADYLLVGETIKSIAIDGANRKWLGTKSSGVYLMSANGQETIKHFTVSNSPLMSNDILSIAINPVTGEVFFGTGQGIVSYQSDATEAEGTFTNVYAYPNPVRENYEGVITITGLVENTQVKITDLGGNLICQTISNGGIATWDGKDVHNRKVSTGIYLAICVSSDGTQNAITKILVVN